MEFNGQLSWQLLQWKFLNLGFDSKRQSRQQLSAAWSDRNMGNLEGGRQNIWEHVTLKTASFKVHWEIKGRFRKRVQFWRMCPRPAFRSGGTRERTLVPVFVPGEHPNAPSFRFSFRGSGRGNIRQNHPFGKPPFCQPPKGGQTFAPPCMATPDAWLSAGRGDSPCSPAAPARLQSLQSATCQWHSWLDSKTGRIRFRGVRFQTPNSLNFLALTELRGENSVSSSQPIICVTKRTHRVFRRTHRVCPKTQRGSVSSLLRNSTLETVFRYRFLDTATSLQQSFSLREKAWKGIFVP